MHLAVLVLSPPARLERPGAGEYNFWYCRRQRRNGHGTMQHSDDDPGSNIEFVHGPPQIRSSVVHSLIELLNSQSCCPRPQDARERLRCSRTDRVTLVAMRQCSSRNSWTLIRFLLKDVVRSSR